MAGERAQFLVGYVDLLQEHLEQDTVEIIAAEVLDAGRGEDVEVAAVDPNYGGVESAAAQIEDSHRGWRPGGHTFLTSGQAVGQFYG